MSVKIYKNGEKEKKGRHVIHVTPGIDCPTVSDFKDQSGKNLLFSVEFNNGVAEVESNLGAYLIDKGLADKSQLILSRAFQ